MTPEPQRAEPGGPSFRQLMVGEIPALRAYATTLSGSRTTADDLVQDTLLKAWGAAASFRPGTNIRAWLFVILRNTYFSQYRRRGREVQDVDGAYSARVGVAGGQQSAVDLADFRSALAQLPEEQREALIMVGASGLSYEEAAEIAGVAVGTVKSRVNRARGKLGQLLGIDSAGEFGEDKHTEAVIRQGGASVSSS